MIPIQAIQKNKRFYRYFINTLHLIYPIALVRKDLMSYICIF